jgi:hypothetical protein
MCLLVSSLASVRARGPGARLASTFHRARSKAATRARVGCLLARTRLVNPSRASLLVSSSRLCVAVHCKVLGGGPSAAALDAPPIHLARRAPRQLRRIRQNLL